MNKISNTKKKSIAAILFVVMLFSCTNDSKKVRDFLAEQNLPIGLLEMFIIFTKIPEE